MDSEPPKWWHKLKLQVLWRLPLEPRKKIKRFIKLGDEYRAQGADALADLCFDLSKQLADHAGAVHLRKKIEQKTQ